MKMSAIMASVIAFGSLYGGLPAFGQQPVRGVAMADLTARIPPLAHNATGRWPMVTWIPFLATATNDLFSKGESLSPDDYRELARRGLTQAIRLDEKFIPMALALQQAGLKVIVVQGAGGMSGDAPDVAHRLDPDFKAPRGRVNPCPLIFEGWHNRAMKNRELFRTFKAAGVTLDGLWMDDEGQPWGREVEWEQSRHCSRCRTLFPAGVLDSVASYAGFIGRLKQDLYSAYMAAPVREVFPACLVLNWGLIVSTPEAPTPSYWGNTWHSPRTAGLFTGLNPVAYGNDIDYTNYWSSAWKDPAGTPLDAAHMDRLYTQVMLAQVSRNAENAEKWAPDLLCIPWVCRYCPDMGDARVPELTRPRYREILRHIWLRGADSMQVFNPPRPALPGLPLEEIEDAVSVYDEMLAYREFLDGGTVLNTALSAAADDGVVWSGLKRGDRAVIRAFTQGSAPVVFSVKPWADRPAFELEAPPAGVTFLLSAAGEKTRVPAAR